MTGRDVTEAWTATPDPTRVRHSGAAAGELPRRALAKIILVMLLWALCFPLITVGLSSVTPLYFAATRALLAGAALLLLATALRRPHPAGPATWAALLAIGLTATSLGFLGMFLASQFVAPGFATVIANTQPLIAAVLAAWILGETLGRREKAALVLGFAGVVTMTLPRLAGGNVADVAGIAYVLAAAIGVATGNILMKRMAGRVDPLMAMGLQLVLGGLPLMLAALGFEPAPRTLWTPEMMAVLAALALAGTALPFYLWFSLLRSSSLSRANTFSFLTPVFGLAIGVGLFGERLGWPELAGIGLVLVGIWQIGRSQDHAPGSRL